ncbi:neurocalcin-delta A-like [Watersipora subatra]|uniref:neurocalcin-delta A-like n=1 Tax=Watersipora subatra TaxID=2589382 RepID=UPI00355B729A
MDKLLDYTNNVLTEEASYHWYKLFQRMFPDGEISEKELCRIFDTYFPDRNSQVLCKCVTECYTTESEGQIDFLCFMKGLFHACPLDSLILVPFKMLDKDCNGKVSRSDFQEMMSNHYRLIASVSNPFEAARSHLSTFFKSNMGNTMTLAAFMMLRSDAKFINPYHIDYVYMGLAAIGNYLYHNPVTPDIRSTN